MRVKILALACVVALTTMMPARADVILGFRLGTGPSGNDPTDPSWIDTDVGDGMELAPPTLGASLSSGLTLTQGQTAFIQLTIRSNTTTLSSPTPSFPPTAWSNVTPVSRMITFAYDLRYPMALVTNPFAPPVPPTNPDQNNANARASVPFATGTPNTYGLYNMGGTATTGATLGSGVGTISPAGSNQGNVAERVIAVFRLVASASNTGTDFIEIRDLNPLVTAAGFGLSGGQNLDEYIFHPSHINDNRLNITVVPVPEPSSMALAGLAIAGMGWRKLRRNKKAVAA